MKLFFALIFTEFTATLLRLLIDHVRPGFMTDDSLHNSIDPLGNVLFVLLVAVVLWCYRDIRLTVAETLGAIPAFLITVLAMVFIGIFSYDRFHFGLQATALIGTIGYYPAGPDVPIQYGLPIWLASSLLTILVGLLLGAGLRRLPMRHAMTGDVEKRLKDRS